MRCCVVAVSLEGKAESLLRTDSSDCEPFSQFVESPPARHQPIVFESDETNSDVGDSLAHVQFEIGLQEAQDVAVFADGAGEALSPVDEQLQDECINLALDTTNSPAHHLDHLHHDDDAASERSAPSSAAGEALSAYSADQNSDDALNDASSSTAAKCKPPNVLVYCGKKDSQRVFDNARSTFSLCFNPDKYILYNLKHDQVFKAPWLDNTSCLVIASDKVYDGIDAQFLEYFKQGGVVCSFNNAFDAQFCEKFQQANCDGFMKMNYCSWRDVTVTCGPYTYGKGPFECRLGDVTLTALAHDVKGNAVIMLATHTESDGKAILSQVEYV